MGVKIGLAGAGHLGKIHLKCLLNTDFEISGVFDPNPEAVKYAVDNFGVKGYDSLEALIESSDCLDIVTSTVYHYQVASQAIKAGKHVFIEKPVTESVTQAAELTDLSKKHGVIVQVGHVERYNPAVRSLSNVVLNPQFIEGHRLAVFNPRGTDVSVVLDLMIHDLDIILHIIKAEVESVHANGVAIVSDTPDICNARIEFKNGAVANLTASRISMKNMRKIRLFQEDAYISLDLLEKQAEVVRMEECSPEDKNLGMTIPTKDGFKRLYIENPEIMKNNAIEDELRDFYDSVVNGSKVSVTIDDGLRALNLAHIIQGKIEKK